MSAFQKLTKIQQIDALIVSYKNARDDETKKLLHDSIKDIQQQIDDAQE